MLKEQPEHFNARWRKYTCGVCGRRYDVFTVSVVPAPHICFDCQKQHTTLKAYANALGACIKEEV